MSHAAGPPGGDQSGAAPEPTFAERARTLAHVGRNGTLATISRRYAGHPFASVMPYALDSVGRPLLLISAMAVHTQNIEADPRVSLLITQPDWSDDPLAAGRLTLMGIAVKVRAIDVTDTREAYLARHQGAKYWVDFDDFGFWRVDIIDVYFVGGFAAMDWVTATAYATAQPDPLAHVAPGIIEHMNRDHGEALVAYARHFARAPADGATMVGIDKLGFKLRLRCGESLSSVRVAFPCEVTTAAQSREVLIRMLRTTQRG